MVTPSSGSEHLSPGSSLSVNQLPSDIFHSEPKLLANSEPSAADKLKTLISDYGFTPTKIPDLISQLPPRRLRNRLVDHYFSAMCVFFIVGNSRFVLKTADQTEIGLVTLYRNKISVLRIIQYAQKA